MKLVALDAEAPLTEAEKRVGPNDRKAAEYLVKSNKALAADKIGGLTGRLQVAAQPSSKRKQASPLAARRKLFRCFALSLGSVRF
jgi:hypothetical protein